MYVYKAHSPPLLLAGKTACFKKHRPCKTHMHLRVRNLKAAPIYGKCSFKSKRALPTTLPTFEQSLHVDLEGVNSVSNIQGSMVQLFKPLLLVGLCQGQLNTQLLLLYLVLMFQQGGVHSSVVFQMVCLAGPGWPCVTVHVHNKCMIGLCCSAYFVCKGVHVHRVACT